MSLNFEVPEVGSSVSEYISRTELWQAIGQVIQDYERRLENTAKGSSSRSYSPTIVGQAQMGRTQGSLVRVTGIRSTAIGVSPSQLNKPTAEIANPTWPDNLSSVYPLQKSKELNTAVDLRSGRYMHAPINRIKATDGWAMPDPDDPQMLRSADFGIYKIIGMVKDASYEPPTVDPSDPSDPSPFDPSDPSDPSPPPQERWIAVLDLEQQQPVVRIENGKLMRHDGDVFSDTPITSILQEASDGLFIDGKIYPLSSAALFLFTLKQPWSGISSPQANIYTMEDVLLGTAPIYDPLFIFRDLGPNNRGICQLQDGKHYAIQAPCPPGSTLSGPSDPSVPIDPSLDPSVLPT